MTAAAFDIPPVQGADSGSHRYRNHPERPAYWAAREQRADALGKRASCESIPHRSRHM